MRLYPMLLRVMCSKSRGSLLAATAIQVVRVRRFFTIWLWWVGRVLRRYWPAFDGGERQGPYQLLVAPAVHHGCEDPLVRQWQTIDEMQDSDAGAPLFLTIKSHPTAAWSLGRQLHARTIHDRVEVLTCADGPRSENIQTNRSGTPEEIAVRSRKQKK